jgi:hypothetical protein
LVNITDCCTYWRSLQFIAQIEDHCNLFKKSVFLGQNIFNWSYWHFPLKLTRVLNSIFLDHLYSSSFRCTHNPKFIDIIIIHTSQVEATILPQCQTAWLPVDNNTCRWPEFQRENQRNWRARKWNHLWSNHCVKTWYNVYRQSCC